MIFKIIYFLNPDIQMMKSFTVKEAIIELLNDGRLHCLKYVISYINDYCKTENIKVSSALISYNIQVLCKNSVIEKYGKFIKIKNI